MIILHKSLIPRRFSAIIRATMSDPDNEKKTEKPVDPQPENTSATTDAAVSEIISTNLTAENMEVHHHAHHEGKKSWKSYAWEFAMLFLAVFCSFLAELQLEHTIEHHREKEFIESMVKEMESDNQKIVAAFNDTVQNNRLDTLVMALADVEGNPENVKKAYIYKSGIGALSALKFNKSTISQLKNGGNMRLIRKPEVVNQINVIDNNIDYLEVQGGIYDKFVVNNLQYVSKIFDIRYRVRYKSLKIAGSYDEFIMQQPEVKYLSDNEALRMEFASQLVYQKRVFDNYIFMLEQQRQLSEKMIAYFKEEYHLD